MSALLSLTPSLALARSPVQSRPAGAASLVLAAPAAPSIHLTHEMYENRHPVTQDVVSRHPVFLARWMDDDGAPASARLAALADTRWVLLGSDRTFASPLALLMALPVAPSTVLALLAALPHHSNQHSNEYDEGFDEYAEYYSEY